MKSTFAVASTKHQNFKYHLLFDFRLFSLSLFFDLTLSSIFFLFPPVLFPLVSSPSHCSCFLTFLHIHAGSLACQLLICMLLNCYYLASIHSHPPPLSSFQQDYQIESIGLYLSLTIMYCSVDLKINYINFT